MSVENFDKSLTRILVYEGGNDDDKRDPGGRTSRGIIQREYNVFRKTNGLPARDVWLASDDEIREIYKTSYWDRIHADEMPDGLDLVLFDSAVNSGVGQAAKWVQRSLDIRVDGDFGPQTLAAIKDAKDDDMLIEGILDRRMAMLKSLKTYRSFGGGWSARVANVRKIGEAWATGSIGPMPVAVHEIGGHKKALIEDVKTPIVSVSAAQVSVAATSVSTGITSFTQQAAPVVDTLGEVHWLSGLKYGFAGMTLLSVVLGVIATVAHNQAEAAKSAEATSPVDMTADEKLTPVPVNDNTPPPVTTEAKAA